MNDKEIDILRKEMKGYTYRHFKGGMYVVTELAVHTETDEIMVVYKNMETPDLVWCRPLDMFLSEVDHENYPNVEQTMRFEKIEEI